MRVKGELSRVWQCRVYEFGQLAWLSCSEMQLKSREERSLLLFQTVDSVKGFNNSVVLTNGLPGHASGAVNGQAAQKAAA